MASDARFGIELYEDPTDRQTVDGASVLIVGHVWSPDAERIVETPDGRVLIIDPSGRNATGLNRSLADTEAFLEAFRVFYLGDRPPVAPPMTRDEARARLAALQRGETLAPPATPEPIPRDERVRRLRRALDERDAPAVAPGTWWARILARPEFD